MGRGGSQPTPHSVNVFNINPGGSERGDGMSVPAVSGKIKNVYRTE